MSGDALDDQLEAKAAKIETNGGLATTSIGWSSLKGDFDTVFAQTMDLLMHPEFKADKLQLAKRQLDTGIARRNDDASSIASREAQAVVYGPTSPLCSADAVRDGGRGDAGRSEGLAPKGGRPKRNDRLGVWRLRQCGDGTEAANGLRGHEEGRRHPDAEDDV